MNFKAILVLFHALVLTAASQWKIEQLDLNDLFEQNSAKREVLYLPSGEGLEVLTLGYRNVVSDILWFHTLNYFGRHYQSDRNYHWLSHMCNLVTDLNSRAREAFEFCALMLTWEAGAPKEAVKLLGKAISIEPDYWRYRYMRGFSFMFFLEDAERAKQDFVAASQIPGAPAFLARLAARKIALSDPLSAIQFLESALENATDEAQKEPLESRLREMRFEYTVETLESAVKSFRTEFGRLPVGLRELVSSGRLHWADPTGFSDFYGGQFYLDLDSGEIKSTGRGDRKKWRKN